jgi:hypothetical protein
MSTYLINYFTLFDEVYIIIKYIAGKTNNNSQSLLTDVTQFIATWCESLFFFIFCTLSQVVKTVSKVFYPFTSCEDCFLTFLFFHKL